MPSNHSNSTDNCSLSPQFYQSANFFFDFAYYGVTYGSHIPFSLACVLAIRAFYLESKSEGAYRYQILLTTCDLLEVLGSILHGANVGLIGIQGFERHDSIAEYLQTLLGVIWFRAHVSSPFINALFTTGLLISLCMALDRITAIRNPISYKLADHERRLKLCAWICTLIGFGTSVYDCFRWTVIAEEPSSISSYRTSYVVRLNSEYIGSHVWIFFNQLRNTVRFCAWLALIASNVTLLVVYDRRMKISRHITQADDHRCKQAKRKQKVLFVLTISQCVTKTLTTFFILIVYSLYIFFPRVYECGLTLMAPLLDGCMGLMPAVDFVLVVIASKTFRRMLRRALCGDAGIDGNSVVPVGIGG